MAAAYQLHRIKPQVSTVYCSPIFHDIFIKNYEWLQRVVFATALGPACTTRALAM